MHEQTAQIGVASLANAEQSLFSSGAASFGRQPKRSSHLSAAGKLAGVSYRCQQSRCGKGADTPYFLQAHRGRILPSNLFYLPVELFDTLVEGLQISPQSALEPAKTFAYPVSLIFEPARDH